MATAPKPERRQILPLKLRRARGSARVTEASSTPAAAPEDRARLYALDVFRGGAIAGVILINTVGTFPEFHPHLGHSAWEGLTVADVGFPFFLFIVGVTADFAMTKRRAAGATKGYLVRYALIRAAILFAIGLIGSAVPDLDMSALRIPGVLQRIAVTYFLGSMIALYTGTRGRMIAATALLIGYWAIMTVIPVPGTGTIGMHTLDRPEATLAAWVDKTVLGGHIWSETVTWDPEGILSTIPAVATVLMGTMAGAWLRRREPIAGRAAGLMAIGTLTTVAGAVWSFAFPVIKGIWTSSFALISAGLAALILGACLWVIDMRRVTWWTPPFIALGVNPLAIYIGSSLVDDLLEWATVSAGGSRVQARNTIYEALLESWLDPRNASLAYGLLYLLIWVAVAWWLYRRGIRIRV